MPLGVRWSEAAGLGGRSGSAAPRRLAPGPMAVLLVIGLSSVAWTPALPGRGSARPECRVQIISVKLSKATIHTSREPREVTLGVSVDVRGRPPKGATATVEVGTYSAGPAGNDVVYLPPERTLLLKPGRAAVEFSIRAGPKTSAGHVVVAATLQPRKQRGVRIVSMQPNYREWRVRLATRAP